MSKRIYETLEKGCSYQLPMWKVEDGKGIVETGQKLQIHFVRGSKLADEVVEKRDGVLHETLLAMIIDDLKFKSTLVPSRETSLAITKLEEGLHWMEERQRERNARDVQGTYKK